MICADWRNVLSQSEKNVQLNESVGDDRRFFCVRAVVSAGRRDYIGIKERQGRQKI